MAIAVYFHPQGMSTDSYHEIHRRLDAAGQSHPAGRTHHSCFGVDGDLMVYDIWDSPQSFEAFGAVLMPVLADIGIDPGTPDIMPIVHIIQ